ncbi:MAG: LuxR family transcriptional regulator [Micavibrio aeruginosavorus]|uniref:LuxR family transcriptional regulator n=1 Tax=Micavibrio aeruginosavorus TaxID=349221 RepID=A0A7T5UGU2_9BACT|nr:MAG: LuxR family transcriptional regulator [Micavibrio aeruginosavorus]
MSAGLRNYSFEDYVTEANQARDVDTLFSIFLKTVAQHGLDRAIFSLSTDHHDIGQEADFGIVHNYPESWLKYYSSNNLKYIDPVMLYGATQIDTFSWDDIPKRILLSRKQKLCLDMGDEAGLRNGVCTPLRGPQNQLAGIALATTERKDAFDGNVDMVNAYCNHFYIAYKRILRRKTQEQEQEQNIVLTDKEREVLKWAALGKTDTEIGLILNMSKNTVDSHMRKVFRKLEANNRVLAVVKAITLGLVHL